ncbi:MAG TPA: M2 family metallopeptidase [Thermoplasmata archaeon]|jgi:peptidyl-dipeptidase A|nr:M2 family metallopeptidase [Thermoplasmata archaeon]
MSATDPATSEFLSRAERRLLDLSVEAQRADWVYATYIQPDTEALSAQAYSRLIGATVELAKESTTLGSAAPSPTDRRKLKLLRLTLPLIAPSNPPESEELTRLVATMQGTFAKGRHVPVGGTEPVDLQGLSRILAESRDPAALEDAWTGWHRVGRGIRTDFTRYVELANRGARELGFADTGAMWRSKYDETPEALAGDVERLWQEVRPLYVALHAYVRRRLREVYGADRVPAAGPIPAHLLGNMWAQSWEAIYPLLAPAASADGFDLTRELVARRTSPEEMVRYAERFFVSLGLPPLPGSFWQRSMLVRPRDREVVCHASAWDIDFEEDLRIKMCIEITGEDFATIHHELGHNYYQRAYARQPFLFRDSAHDGFHEALGDTIGLSVTPEYLVRIGLLERAPDASGDLGLLLLKALEKIAFLPFGLLVDRWRWEVFSGAIGPAEYNRRWWAMRAQYQGIAPPSERDEAEFDAGAKYHVPANVPYLRYFLAHILQFQFHAALRRAVGSDLPLHRFSIYGSTEAGRRLDAMMAMGASREWPDALEALTGERRMDARGLLDYFAPLAAWLDEQNAGAPVGW